MIAAPPVVLTIAGFDPSSGAGVTADLKTIAAHGCYGVACITALTVQSTRGVRRVVPTAPDVVRQTLEEIADDVPIAAIHIGMLGKGELVGVVGEFLAKRPSPNVVLDPVLQSSSGAELLEASAVKLLVEKLMPRAAVITPNLDEASVLTGLPVTNITEMRSAAARLHTTGAKAVVITGGHLDPATDLLSIRKNESIVQEEFSAPHQRSRSTHGTGCAFATAIACNLAVGKSLTEAVSMAKNFVTAAIAKAYPLGNGIGPMNHLYRLDEK